MKLTVDEQLNRITAELNAEASEVYANCEECGAKIPTEYALCRDCEAERAGQDYADSHESNYPRCVW